jgi:hypothetical protein
LARVAGLRGRVAKLVAFNVEEVLEVIPPLS